MVVNKPLKMADMTYFQNCNFCPKKFFTKTGLKIHLNKLHENQLPNKDDKNQVQETKTTSAIECLDINSKQSSKTQIESDTVVNFESKEKMTKIPANSKTKNMEEVVQHLNQKKVGLGLEKKKLYKCLVCNKELSGGLKNHVLSVHEKQRLFKCHICQKSFAASSSLRLHVKILHEKQRLNKCHLCDFKCRFNSSMKRHINVIHEKQKPFKCPICDSKFYDNCSVKRHIRGVHEKQKPFQCSFCEKHFSQSGSLNFHVRTLHKTKNI